MHYFLIKYLMYGEQEYSTMDGIDRGTYEDIE